MKRYLVFLFAFVFAFVSSIQARDNKPLPTTAGSKLTNGIIYVVDKDITITASNTCGLAVDDNSTVTIYIQKGKTLKVTGGNADGIQGAYPGIYVPSTSTLIITGEGRIEAYGGNCSKGQQGGNGGNGHVYVNGGHGASHATAGSGGNGGDGGGGAAPGIGAKGGAGAKGLTGPAGPTNVNVDGSFDEDGNGGHNAVDPTGSADQNMGSVYILGTIAVKAKAGNANGITAAAAGDNGANDEHHWSNYYSASGGGAGGGGGSGFIAPYGIGGGAYGGQSGATGGSGGTLWKFSGYKYLHGGSGDGGYGAVNGLRQPNGSESNSEKHGGNGGTAQEPTTKCGDHGKFYVSKSVAYDITGDRKGINAESHENISYKVLLNGNGGNVAKPSIKAYLGVQPESVDIPTKDNNFFLGYYTSETGGDMYYDSYGAPVRTYDRVDGDLPLYAHWSDAHIKTVSDFEALCIKVFSGVNTKGVTYYLANDLDLSHNHDMLGSSEYPFEGTFDGQGYTITLGGNRDGIFSDVRNATIKNLNVTGDVSVNGNEGGSIVARANGLTLEKCSSDAAFIDEDISTTVGGLVGNSTGTLKATNCAYTGKIKRYGTAAGLVGSQSSDANAYFEDCFVGNVFQEGASYFWFNYGHAIINKGDGKLSVKNVYHNNKFNTSGCSYSPSVAYTDEEQENGTLCFKINENSTNGAWYQNIGEDDYPTLNVNHRKVFCDYSAQKKENVTHNRNYVLLNRDATFYTGYRPVHDTQIFEVYEEKNSNIESNRNGKIILFKNQVYEYLYNNGKVTVDNIPTSQQTVTSYTHDIGTYPISYQGACKIYEIAIMESGVMLHHYLPSNYLGKVGFFDVVKQEFIPVDGAEVFIDRDIEPCEHKNTIYTEHNGIKSSRCYICDKVFDTTYYVHARFDGCGAIGDMGEQTILNGEPLRKNQYYRSLYRFNGWKAYNREGKQIGKDLYTDGETLSVGKEFCDTLTFKAQWQEAFTYNGDTLVINNDNIKRIDIIDDTVNGFATAKPFTASSISYTRTLPANNQWGSLCLPFAISRPDNDILLFTTGSISRNPKTLQEEITLVSTDHVDAGVPCMFYDNRPNINTQRTITFTATSAPVVPTPATVPEASALGSPTQVTLHGTFTGEAFKCDTTTRAYYGVMNNVFYNVGTSYVIYPYHAYITMPHTTPSAAKAIYYIAILDHPTAVTTVPATVPDGFAIGLPTTVPDDSSSAIHDLTGRKLHNITQPGIYILNRKKIYVKK